MRFIRTALFLAAPFAVVFSVLSPASAATVTTFVSDGWRAAAGATISSQNNVTPLSTEDNNGDVTAPPGKAMSAHKWVGVYFAPVTIPAGQKVDSVIVNFRVRAKNNDYFYCEASNNRAATKWSNAVVDDETGAGVNVSTFQFSNGAWNYFALNVSSIATNQTQINNMEILFRNDDASNVLLIDYIDAVVTYSASVSTSVPPVDVSSFTITAAETVDDDLDGKLDAYHVMFSTPINDASLQIVEFAVAGHSGLSFASTGTPHHADTANDSDIYLRFNEAASADTAEKPDLTFTKHLDGLASLAGDDLENVSSGQLAETDKAAPVLLSAVAGDGNAHHPGIDNDDIITLRFSEKTNAPSVNWDNITEVFALSSGHVLTDGHGKIKAVWNAPDNDVLTLQLSVAQSPPTVAPGDVITIAGSLIKDTAGNSSSGGVTVTGDFTATDSVPPQVDSIKPADNAIGVKTNADIKVTFTESLDPAALQNIVGLSLIRDNAGKNLAPALPVAGASVLSGNDRIVTFSPTVPLEKGCLYRITITTAATDLNGNPLANAVTSQFQTFFNPAKENVCLAKDERSKIVLPENSVKESVAVEINLDPVANPVKVDKNAILAANGKMVGSSAVDGGVREINLYGEDGALMSGLLASPAMVTIPYSESGGVVAGSHPPVREKDLRMYLLDPDHNLWVQIPESTVDIENNLVSAPTPHFSVFGIFGAGSDVSSGPYAFPVPFKAGRDSHLSFADLGTQATIKIYTLGGDLIRKISHSSGTDESWDLKNDDGKDIAQGVYLYSIESGAARKKGKLVILR